MPVIFASLIFAISLSLLPYTEAQSDEAEMDRLKREYLIRKRRRSVEGHSTTEPISRGRQGDKDRWVGLDTELLSVHTKYDTSNHGTLPSYLTTRRRSLSSPHPPTRRSQNLPLARLAKEA